ncbi:glycosyltransferase family 2 protein [Chlorobium sp. N1]|uniref:glycosyltransferase family 2 protein n=1 Tax=Chlorobium sp. N1 TaxID=2491138 RepID=UPI001040B6EC|nr:glycosyltransferase family 2 protein [Chlorobium sp. N1]TCD48923.1 glycosyltransferase [Chlorobium sp. N1]
MKCSLVITTYNWPEALELSLMSALRQTEPPDEVIVADDGSRPDTAELVERYRRSAPVPVVHVWQEDLGFRAAASRNRAIAAACGEYVVIVDGDMVLHCDFIRDHKRLARRKTFIQGSRVMVSEEATRERLLSKDIGISPFGRGIGNRKSALRLPWLAGMLARTTEHLRGIRSCNMSFFREDCIRVNGFNEDFTGWGREDSEFAVRMLNSGVLRRNVRFSAIAAHLWHRENARQSLPENDRLLEEAITEKRVRCPNGIDKYLEKQQA